MKFVGIFVMAGLIALTGAAFAQEATHEGHGHEAEGMMCPIKVEGAKVDISNTPDGVRIEITSTDPVKVKEIQDKSAHATEGMAEVYACPMGDHTSNAPGKCPTCGMDLVKK